jgi:hypothetical protein
LSQIDELRITAANLYLAEFPDYANIFQTGLVIFL